MRLLEPSSDWSSHWPTLSVEVVLRRQRIALSANVPSEHQNRSVWYSCRTGLADDFRVVRFHTPDGSEQTGTSTLLRKLTRAHGQQNPGIESLVSVSPIMHAVGEPQMLSVTGMLELRGYLMSMLSLS